jgi:hypothetical protein
MWIKVAAMHFEGPTARWLQSKDHRVRVATWIELCSWMLYLYPDLHYHQNQKPLLKTNPRCLVRKFNLWKIKWQHCQLTELLKVCVGNVERNGAKDINVLIQFT